MAGQFRSPTSLRPGDARIRQAHEGDRRGPQAFELEAASTERVRGTSDGWAQWPGLAAPAPAHTLRAHRRPVANAAPTLHAGAIAEVRPTDHKIMEMNRGARRAKFWSHTDRWENDPRYVVSCTIHGYPKWFQWPDGSWVPKDGSDNRGQSRR